MICEKCGKDMVEAEICDHGGRKVCEDCLMDLMSPAKACDPWAVKLAKGSLATNPAAELKGLEKALHDDVTANGHLAKEAAPAKLGATPAEIERAFSVLRHMELLRGRRRADGGVDFVPFK